MVKDSKYLNETLSFEERAKDLVAQMTLEEKISQTVYTSVAIPRLGIKAYNWWNEALHGVARAGVATVFPQAIGLSATFDEDLMFDIANVISTEGRGKYNAAQEENDTDIYKGLTFWSPNVNIFRDPRWGRGHETYGEDPYLTSRLGVRFIEGIQGNDKKYLKGAACAKHFAVHSGPEEIRHEFDAQCSQKDLYETYLPAFKACVDAGVEAVMGAYNRTNGEPCCGSKTLLEDILRVKWGFKGHVTSDCWAIKDFHENHKVTATAPESVALAINNGCDTNCGHMYLNLTIAVNEGLVTESTIDKSLVRLMMTRMKLGMFDKPEHVPYSKISYKEVDTPENTKFNLEVAKKTLVLLKNKDNFLPLNKDEVKSIAVIGPNADSRAALEGNYMGTASQYITVLEGIKQTVNENTRVYYAPGCHLYEEKTEHLAVPGDRMGEAIQAAKAADISIVCLGLDANIEGEEGDQSNAFAGGDKKDLRFPGEQNKLLKNIINIGKPVIVVVLAGSSMDLLYADEKAEAIIQAWYPGAQGGKAIASLLFGEFSPSGKLPITMYRSTEDLPEFTDYNMTNRTYRYFENAPLYPFGYGLSYTTFSYSDLKIDSKNIMAGENVKLTAKVKNTGNIEGSEITQLYIKDIEGSAVLPKWSLKGISVNHLLPGEEKEIEFDITPEKLSIFNEEGTQILEPGDFKIYIGTSQPDELSATLSGLKCLETDLYVKGETITF